MAQTVSPGRSHTPGGAPPNRFRILFIEDNPAGLLLFRFVLNANNVDNVDLQVVNRGDDALKMIEAVASGKAPVAPDLIILDLSLPVVDGLEILKQIRTHSRFDEVPIIVMTGSPSVEAREAATALRVTEYLCKTSDLDGAIALGKTVRRRLGALGR